MKQFKNIALYFLLKFPPANEMFNQPLCQILINRELVKSLRLIFHTVRQWLNANCFYWSMFFIVLSGGAIARVAAGNEFHRELSPAAAAAAAALAHKVYLFIVYVLAALPLATVFFNQPRRSVFYVFFCDRHEGCTCGYSSPNLCFALSIVHVPRMSK